MAPSRALLRCAVARVASTPSTLSRASSIPSARLLHSSSFPRPILTRALPGIFTTTPVRRWQSTAASEAVEAPDYLDERELHIFNLLKEELAPVRLEVQDVSGGCGSMYALDIVSEKFKGLTVIKQHRLVNSVLAEEIKKWHGVQLKTKAP